jgi:hypothetical protein
MESDLSIQRLQKKIANIKSKEYLSELEDTVDSMLSEPSTDFWNELTDEQKKNINISIGQLNEGKVKNHEEVEKIANSWLKI